MKKKDLYDILGVNKSSSQQDIKLAYYKLAQKWHPDKNPSKEAKEVFAEINNAYETLGDEQKRKVYDQVGLTGDEQQQGPFGAGNPFGGGNPFEGFWGGQTQGQQGENIFEQFEDLFGGAGFGGQTIARKGQDIIINLDIEFMDSINGLKKDVTFEKKGTCPTCKGSKCKPGTAPSRCTACGGKGTVNYRQGPMVVQMVCSKCKGTGVTIKYPCTTCKGVGVARVQHKEEINIPRGVDNGQNLRIPGKGNQSESGGRAGDLLIKLNIKSDPFYRRDGYDIYTTQYLTISDAVLGKVISVKTLHGQKDIVVKPGTQHGDKTLIRGYGIHKLPPNHDQRGDHFVVFKVHIPSNVNQQQKQMFEELQKIEQKIKPEMNNDNSRHSNSSRSNSQHSRNYQQQQQQPDEEEEEQQYQDIFSSFRKKMWK